MGELQQKCQEKLQSQKIAGSAKHEHEYIQTALKAEIKGEYGDHSMSWYNALAWVGHIINRPASSVYGG